MTEILGYKTSWVTAPEIVKTFGKELAKTIIEDATALGQIKIHKCGLGGTVTFYPVRSEIDIETRTMITTYTKDANS